MLFLHARRHQHAESHGVLPPPPARPYHERTGVIHVHTRYSDGRGQFDEVVETARRCGLDFLITTDHSTLAPLQEGKEGYYGSCLALVGVEVTCREGYVLALDVPPEFTPTLNDDAASVLERIEAAGGIAFLSLVCDPRFAWRRIPSSGFAGIEVVNMGTMGMRRINPPNLLRAMARYHLRGSRDAFALLARRPTPELRTWDRLTRERRVAGIGSVDAHARLKVFGGHVPLPSYEDSFSLMRTHVLCRERAVGDARRDASLIYEALAAGRCFASFHVHGDAQGFRFFAHSGGHQATMGEEIALGSGVTLYAHANGTEAAFRLVRDGAIVTTLRGQGIEYPVTQPGVYRLEVYRWCRRVGPYCLGLKPWILSNPIYVRPGSAPAPAAVREEPGLAALPLP